MITATIFIFVAEPVKMLAGQVKISKMNESLERHEDEEIMTLFSFLGEPSLCSPAPHFPKDQTNQTNGQQNAPDMRCTAFTHTGWIWGHMHWQLVIIMTELMAAFPAPHWLWECAPLYCTAVNTARKMLRMHRDDRRYRKHFSWQTTTSSINLPHRRRSSSQQQSPRCTAQKHYDTI